MNKTLDNEATGAYKGGTVERGTPISGHKLDSNMVNELRNFHVKKLLTNLGGKDVAPYLQKAIKRAFSEFAEDITKKDSNNDTTKEISGNY